jgi:phospholipid transport system substrate-binding protein
MRRRVHLQIDIPLFTGHMKISIPFSNFIFSVMLLVVTAFGSSQAFAQEAPDVLLKRLSTEILDTIKSDKELQKGNTVRVREVVKSKVLPHVDFERTTSIVVGRHWRDATPEQRRQLTEGFHDLLIYTYSGGLSLVGDQKLEFRPLRTSPDDTDVVVHSQVIQRGREPIQLSYRVEKKPDGWKVYDISVLGVWLTETYKNTFASEINRNGIDGLIRMLSEKNRQLAAAKAS